MALNENFFPCIDAKFILIARVLKGWTMVQPAHPPSPEVAKMTALGSGGGEAVLEEGEVASIVDVGIVGIIVLLFFCDNIITVSCFFFRFFRQAGKNVRTPLY